MYWLEWGGHKPMLWLIAVSRDLGSTGMTPMVRSLLIVHTPRVTEGLSIASVLLTLMWSRQSVLEILIGVLVDIQTVCNVESVQ